MCNHRGEKTGLPTIIPRNEVFICTQCGDIVSDNKENLEGDDFIKSWNVIKEKETEGCN